MNIIIDILILSFVGVLYFQRAGGSPDSLRPNHISLDMMDGSHYGGSDNRGLIVEGNTYLNLRFLPYWMEIEQRWSRDIYIYILLKNGQHFESALDPTNVHSYHRPNRPWHAELHTVYNGNDQYFTTGRFVPHDVRRDWPIRTGNPSDSRIYVQMKEGNVFTAVLNRYIPKGKEPALIVHDGASTSNPDGKMLRE